MEPKLRNFLFCDAVVPALDGKMICYGIFSDLFVPKFFGQGYDRVALIINVISPIILFIGMSNVIGTQYLLPTKLA